MAYCPPAQRRRKTVPVTLSMALRDAREYRERVLQFQDMLTRTNTDVWDHCCRECNIGNLPASVEAFEGLEEWALGYGDLPRTFIRIKDVFVEV